MVSDGAQTIHLRVFDAVRESVDKSAAIAASLHYVTNQAVIKSAGSAASEEGLSSCRLAGCKHSLLSGETLLNIAKIVFF